MMDEVEKLIKQLKDPEAGPDWVAWTKRRAADKLGNIGDARATEALTEALNDEDSAVRESVVKALGKIKDVRCIPALVDAMSKEDWYLRGEIAWVLGEVGGDNSVPALMDALKDEHWNVRCYAADALANIAEKADIDLDKVKALLHDFVENAGGPKEREMAKREAAYLYVIIAAAVVKRKQAEMGGELLKEKPKPPKGKDRMYRKMRRATA